MSPLIVRKAFPVMAASVAIGIIIALAASCSVMKTEQTVAVSLDGLPDDMRSCKLETVFWDEDEYVGTIREDSDISNAMESGGFNRIYSFARPFTHVSFYLYENSFSSRPDYFFQFERTPDDRYRNSWWLDYKRYFGDNIVRFGKSSQFIQELRPGDTMERDFLNEPYHVYSFSDDNQDLLNISIWYDGENLDAKYEDRFRDLEGYYAKSLKMNTFNLFDAGYDTLFLLLQPRSFSEPVSYGLTASSDEYDSFLLDMRFEFDDVILGSDGALYFDTSLGYGGTVKRVDYKNYEVEDVLSFSDDFDLIEHPGFSGFLIWSEQTLREYTLGATGTAILRSVPYRSRIVTVLPLDDRLIVQEYIWSGAGKRATLFEFSDMTAVEQWDRYIVSGVSDTYAPTSDFSCIYYMRSGSPKDLCGLEIDLQTGELGESFDSIYHGDYPLRAPVRLFPDETRLIDGYGRVYRADYEMALLTDIGYDSQDILFYGGMMVLLRESELILLDENDYSPVATLRTFPEGVIGRNLLLDGDVVISISQDESSDLIYIDEFDLNSAISSGAAMGTSPSPFPLELLTKSSSMDFRARLE